jgi:hypothetical protein
MLWTRGSAFYFSEIIITYISIVFAIGMKVGISSWLISIYYYYFKLIFHYLNQFLLLFLINFVLILFRYSVCYLQFFEFMLWIFGRRGKYNDWDKRQTNSVELVVRHLLSLWSHVFHRLSSFLQTGDSSILCSQAFNVYNNTHFTIIWKV